MNKLFGDSKALACKIRAIQHRRAGYDALLAKLIQGKANASDQARLEYLEKQVCKDQLTAAKIGIDAAKEALTAGITAGKDMSVAAARDIARDIAIRAAGESASGSEAPAVDESRDWWVETSAECDYE